MVSNGSEGFSKRYGTRKKLVSLLLHSAIVAPCILAGSAAFAQETAQEKQAGEITVTAQRREQAAIDVPIAVSVLTEEKVQTLNLSTFTSVAQQTPNFNVTFQRGGNAAPNLSIRGVRGEGSAARLNESSVAVYIDDVYLSDESSLTGQMFDVQRVEVLRGPQGTLFGRNTTGGLVQFISGSPTKELTAKASILYGSDNWVSLNGAVSGPLGERVRTRLAGQFEQHDGHFTNRATLPGALNNLAAKGVWSLRSTTDFDIGDSSSLRVQVTHSETDSETTPGYGLGIWKNQPGPRVVCTHEEILAALCADAIVLGGQPAQNGRRAGDSITELTRDDLAIVQKLTSATAKLEIDLDWASLINVVNYTQFKSRTGLDGDNSSTPSTLGGSRVFAVVNNKSHQFSEELRLQGNSGDLAWVAGLFYYSDQKENSNVISIRNNAGANIAQVLSNAQVNTKSGAVFGQIDWKFTDQLTLTVGTRYSIENRELVAARFNGGDVQALVPETDPVTKDVTGRVSLTWEPTSDNSLYASYSRGAKSVGYSAFYASGTLATNAAQTGPVGQEHVDAFEIGSKNRFFDRSLMINLAGFYNVFKGKQELLAVSVPTPLPGTGFQTVSSYLNLGQVTLYGAELEMNYTPGERWDFSLSGGLLHTEITKSPLIFNGPRLGLLPLQGRPLPQSPKWNVNAVVAYHLPVDRAGVFTLQGEARAQAKQNFGLSNDPLADAPSYGVVNFRILWVSEDKKFNAQLFVTNAFNKAYFSFISDVSAGSTSGVLATQQAEPRLWGAKLGVSF